MVFGGRLRFMLLVPVLAMGCRGFAEYDKGERVSRDGAVDSGIDGRPSPDGPLVDSEEKPQDLGTPPSPVKAEMLAAGDGFSCALFDGSVTCWGRNDHGQLGRGSQTFSGHPETVVLPTSSDGKHAPLQNVTAIAAGGQHACALSDGLAYCWGANHAGQAGQAQASAISRATAITVAAHAPRFTALALGREHSCALSVNGSVWCWGADKLRGTSQTNNVVAPQQAQLSGLSSVTHLACGDYHCCASDSMAVYCWGMNWSGQVTATDRNPRLFPLARNLPESFRVSQLAAGEAFTCAVDLSTQKLYCWGDGWNGQFGTAPDDKTLDATIPILLEDISQLVAGARHTCVLSKNNVYCWGHNRFGELGQGGADHWAIPKSPITTNSSDPLWAKDLACGKNHCCVIDSTSAVWCWGRNVAGTTNPAKPNRQDEPVAGPRGLTQDGTYQLASGAYHSCALMDDPVRGKPALQCWGAAGDGQTGVAVDTSPASPLPHAIPNPGSAAEAPTAFGLGERHSCGFWPTEGVHCWGKDVLHDEPQRDSDWHVPTYIGFTDDWTVLQLAAGRDHSCALLDNNVVWCWGQNYAGQLGLGTFQYLDRDRPKRVAVAASEGIAAAGCTSCAHSVDRLYCWGCNHEGQLGSSSPAYTDRPHAISLPTKIEIRQIALGSTHGCLRVKEGQITGLMCWGSNSHGQLGRPLDDGDYGAKWVMGGTNAIWNSITSVAIGERFTCALRSGKTYCWGDLTAFELGANVSPSHRPTEVSGLADAEELIAGYGHVCARKADELHCWGETSLGQLGDGQRPERRPTQVFYPRP